MKNFKNRFLISAGIIGFVLFTGFIAIETDILTEALSYLSVSGGVQNTDKKVLKNPYQQALPFIALKFRTASTGTIQQGFGKNVTRAAAYAMLDGIDSTVFQSITDEFYQIFTDKLKSAGVNFVDLAKIKASGKYQEFLAAKPAQRYFNHKEYGTASVYSQNNEAVFDIPANGFKMLKYQTEVGGGIAALHLTVDFVEMDMTIGDIHHDFFDASNKTTNATAKVRPAIKITSLWAESVSEGLGALGAANSGGFVMSNKEMIGVIFTGLKPIYAPFYADVTTFEGETPEYAKNHSLFGGGAMQLGTFIVKPEQEAYKKAAIEGLSRYADYVVAIIKSYNEEKK